MRVLSQRKYSLANIHLTAGIGGDYVILGNRYCLFVTSLLVSIAAVGPMLGASTASIAPEAEGPPQYYLYFGDLHSHTDYSDGMGTPDQAYAAARAAGAHFLAVTDHYFQINDAEWEDMILSADRHTEEGAFIAMAAYEFYLPGINEINIYGTETLAPHAGLTPQAYYEGDRMDGDSFLPWLYDWIASETGAIGQWNHPLSYGCPTCWDFYQFDFVDGERDGAMGMIEVYNEYIRESSYIKALDAGWHAMPTATADTHIDDWISGYEMRTVLLAPSLAREDLYDAMRCGRGYATLDKNLEMTFTLNGAVMGSVLTPGGSSFEAAIHIVDPDGTATDAVTLVEIVTDFGEVVWSMGGDGTTEFDEVVTLDSSTASYYWVRVSTESGDLGQPGATAWTAPVWTGN